MYTCKYAYTDLDYFRAASFACIRSNPSGYELTKKTEKKLVKGFLSSTCEYTSVWYVSRLDLARVQVIRSCVPITTNLTMI